MLSMKDWMFESTPSQDIGKAFSIIFLTSMQGKLRESPNVNELSEALVNHDLFIYVGHGNGMVFFL